MPVERVRSTQATPEMLATVRVVGHDRNGKTESVLTGVLVSASGTEGIVLTAAHLLLDSPASITIGVPFHDKVYPATVVANGRRAGNDFEPDVAVLHVVGNRPLPSVPLAAADAKQGDSLALHGFTRGASSQRHYSGGFVSTVGRYTGGSHTTTMTTQEGDSGAGLFSGGKLVGVHWGGVTGESFYTPVSRIRPLIQQTAQRYQWCQPYQGNTQPIAQRPAQPRTQPANNYDRRFDRIEKLFVENRDENKRKFAALEAAVTQLGSKEPSPSEQRECIGSEAVAALIAEAVDARLAAIEGRLNGLPESLRADLSPITSRLQQMDERINNISGEIRVSVSPTDR